jgi:endoglucanase
MMEKGMKRGKIKLMLLLILCALILDGFAQTGTMEDFNDNSLDAAWLGSTHYTLTESNQELSVAVIEPAGGYNVFSYTFNTLDLSNSPYLKIDVKTSAAIKLRIDYQDINGKVTNGSAINQDVSASGSYQTLTYNFAGRFTQTYPSTSPVDASQIVKVVIFVNAGGNAFTGTVKFDNLLIGSNTGILPPPGDIKLNQLGFYPNSEKIAIAVSPAANPFYLVSSDMQDTLYTGTLGAAASFSMTGETVRKADFTSFNSVGSYYLAIPGIGYSHPFEIKPAVHHSVSKAGMKGFYYQRASTALSAANAGTYARAKGHPDNTVYVHNSAANVYRPTNTVISSPGGWYDAGDYNKYMVTAGYSSFMILSMYEHYPSYFDTLNLNIPESGNNIPDILDEALWEIRWMLTMQDPYDGGVYCKLTSPNFDGVIMPSGSSLPRYVVKKTTSSTLDFAATMAQTARIVKLFESELPGLADSCINASIRAWKWARKNPTERYVQTQMSSPSINTGEYPDNNSSDELQWAAMEIYATTDIDSFYVMAGGLVNINPPGWSNTRALGYLSLAHLRKTLNAGSDTTTLKQKVLGQANYLKSNSALCPYGTSVYDTWNFSWGSNGTAAATQGMMLLQAFDITKDSSYLKIALADLDYLMGRNGANYCFVTGYGDVSPMDIHHRISGADGISAPVPGLLAGGPNVDSPSDCGGSSSYPSTFPGKAYLDAFCSYSTNEIAINWNAPFAYLSNVIEAIHAGASSEVLNYITVLPTDIVVISDTMAVVSGVSAETKNNFQLSVYPNPASEQLTIEFKNNNEKTVLTLTDAKGIVFTKKENNGTGEQKEIFDLSGLNKGLYYLLLKSGNATEARKIIVE